MEVLPSCIKLEQDVVHEDTEYASKDVSPHTFLFKGDVINDIPPREIIIETFRHEMMVMSGSQLMTLVLCQVVPYLPLEETGELKIKEIYSKNKDVPHFLIKDVTDDVSSSDEDIDQME